jgi:hypothetical protein
VDYWGEPVAAWLTAVGTVGATWAALYVGAIRDWWRRPKLTLLFDHGTSDAVEVGTTTSLFAAYVRLRVRNETGKATAEDVEVIISGASELGGKPREVDLDGRLLTYSNTEPPAVRLHLPPGGERHVDLAYVLFTKLGMLPGTNRPVVIKVHPLPAETRLASMTPGRLEMELTVAARNVDAARYMLELAFEPDDASDKSVIDHLQVNNLRKV